MDELAHESSAPAGSGNATASDQTGIEPVAKLLLSVLNASSEGILVLDHALRFVFCNPALRALLPDLTSEFAPGRSYGDILKAASGAGIRSAAPEEGDDWASRWLERAASGDLDGRLRNESNNGIRVRTARILPGKVAIFHTSDSEREQPAPERSVDDIIASMGQGVLTLAPDDTVQHANARVAELLELPVELIAVGTPRLRMVEYRAARGDYDENGTTGVDEIMRQFAPGRKATREIATPSGRVVRTDSNPLPNGGSVITYIDITRLRQHAREIERHRADLENREGKLMRLTRELEEANRQKQALLSDVQAILENIDYGVVFMDRELRTYIANRAFRELWAIPDDLIKQRLTMRELIEFNRYNGVYDVDDADWDAFVEARVEAVRKGLDAPIQMHRRDGKVLSYQAVALPDGRRMLTYFDITDLRRQEDRLQHYSQALEVVLNNTRHGLTWFDGDLMLRAWNPKFRELLEFPEDQFELGDPFEKFVRFNVAREEYGDGDPEQQVAERVALAREFEPHTFERTRSDGAVLRIEGYPVPEGGWVTVYADVTEQLKQQGALEEEKERAKAASQAKSEFLANMSHEIRTPLNGILGMAELFLTTELDPRQRNFADTILQSSMSLLTIINDILDFSRIEAGKIQLEPKPFNLRMAVEDVATMVSSQAAEKGLELLVRFRPDTPQHVCADAGRIRQIVTNLLGNALKFTDAGHVLVEVDGRQVGDQAELEISVIDTGIGIPENMLESVFETFRQIDSSSTRRHGGTGLGLAISKRIVEALGGRIGVESEPDRGSRFWVELSLPEAEATEPSAPEALVNLAGLRVLVVDDNDINRCILKEQLTGWGLEPVVVESGSKALIELEQAHPSGKPFELAILDHQMPEMDGAELVRRIKSSGCYADIPIIILTSVGKGDEWALLRSMNVSGLLEKPIRSAVLLDTILEVAAPASAAPEVGALGDAVTDNSDARWTVLIAEDHDMNRTLLEHMLHNTAYRPIFAEDGEAAVRAYKRYEPDLVLMDISMPMMDGYQATRLIRGVQQQRGHRVPIVGVTAHAFDEDRRRCLDSGMDDHLPKPISLSALNGMLERWLPNQPEDTASVA